MPGPAPSFTVDKSDPKKPLGAPDSTTLTKTQLGDWLGTSVNTPQHAVAVKLFYRGGRPEDYHYRVNSNLNANDVLAHFTALTRKAGNLDIDTRIGNIAAALANWYTYQQGR